MAEPRDKQNSKEKKPSQKPSQPAKNNKTWQSWLKDPQFKPVSLGVLAGVALPLLVYFVASGNTDAQYALILSSCSAAIILWALPNVMLALTGAFLFLQPLVIYLGNTDYSYTKMIFSLFFISLLLIVWVADLFRRSPIKIQFTHLIWPGLILIGVMAISLINGRSFLASFQYITLVFYYLFFYLFLVNTVDEIKELKFLLRVILFAGFLACIYGIMQYFGVLLGAPGAKGDIGAIISTFGNKNYLAGFLAYLFVPGLLLLYKPDHPLDRWYSLLVLSMSFITLAAANSDSAWIAVLLSSGLFVAGIALAKEMGTLQTESRWVWLLFGVLAVLSILLLFATEIWVLHIPIDISKLGAMAIRIGFLQWIALAAIGFIAFSGSLFSFLRARERRRWLWAGAGILAALVLAFFLTPPGGSLMIKASRELSAKWDDARSQDWLIGLDMFKDHPITGTGLGDFKREFLDYKGEFLASPEGAGFKTYIQRAAQAHNEYVQMLAELGILGILGILSFVGVLLWSLIKRCKQSASSENRWVLVCLFAGVVAFMGDSFFSFPLHLPANALALVFLLALLQSRAVGQPIFEAKLSKSATAALSLAVVVIVGVTLNYARRDWIADYDLDQARDLYYSAKSNPDDVERLLQESIRNDFVPSEAYYWLGLIHYQSGDYEKSQDYFLRSLPLFTTESTYFYLAVINEQAKQYDQALKYAKQLLEMSPDPSLKPDTLQLEAVVTYNQGQPDQGIQALKELSKTYRDSSRILYTLAQMYVEQGQIAGKKGDLQRANKMEGNAKDALKQASNVIDKRLEQIDKILSPDPGVKINVSKSDYFELKTEKTTLLQLQQRITDLLGQLP
ncbi:O-antigen ligase family protein [Candidatus Acetothermia bacterium]|nr:O-antigen ligase family protein [Candidatus Acetothermia bacterium]MBI3643963.1 O-antigen ligase family protein [Candidatus Acetothermia bacterium]